MVIWSSAPERSSSELQPRGGERERAPDREVAGEEPARVHARRRPSRGAAAALSRITGAAAGSIIATIITHHIDARAGTRLQAPRGGGMAIGGSDAGTVDTAPRRHAHARAAQQPQPGDRRQHASASPVTGARGAARRRAATASAADDAVAVEVEVGELAVAVGVLELRSARSSGCVPSPTSATSYSKPSGRRICARTGSPLTGLRIGWPSISTCSSTLSRAVRPRRRPQIDRHEQRLVHRLDGRGEHREHGRERVGVAAAHDRQQRIALRLAGALVDERGALALAFVDRPGPAEHRGDVEPRQVGIAVAPSSIAMPNTAWQKPLSGSPPNWQLQPYSQLQLAISRPFRRQ
jgi:hypothetical protein